MVAGGRYTAALRRDAASRLAEPFAWTSSQFHLKWSPYLGKFQVQVLPIDDRYASCLMTWCIRFISGPPDAQLLPPYVFNR